MTASVVFDFKKFAGIKNAQDRSSIAAPNLWQALNCDCDNDGILSRRGGFAAGLSGSFHSGWTASDQSISLAVRNETELCVMAAHPSTGLPIVQRVLRSDLTPGLGMAYEDVNDKAYYTNGQVIGVVDKVTATLTSFPAITKQLSAPMPAGHLMFHYNGRMYVCKGNVMYYSAPMDFGRIELRKSFIMFPGILTMAMPVDDGIWVASGSTYFMAGATPKEFILRQVASYNAIPNTAVAVDMEQIIGSEGQGDAAMWESERGPCMGFSAGKFINLGLNAYEPQTAIAGSAVIRKNRKGTYQYLALTHT